jgi:hypothetical protein
MVEFLMWYVDHWQRTILIVAICAAMGLAIVMLRDHFA